MSKASYTHPRTGRILARDVGRLDMLTDAQLGEAVRGYLARVRGVDAPPPSDPAVAMGIETFWQSSEDERIGKQRRNARYRERKAAKVLTLAENQVVTTDSEKGTETEENTQLTDNQGVLGVLAETPIKDIKDKKDKKDIKDIKDAQLLTLTDIQTVTEVENTMEAMNNGVAENGAKSQVIDNQRVLGVSADSEGGSEKEKETKKEKEKEKEKEKNQKKEIEIEKEKEEEKEERAFDAGVRACACEWDWLPGPFVTLWQTWLAYKRARRNSYANAKTMAAAFRRLYNLAGGDPVRAAEIVEYCIAQNYQGLFAPRNENGNGNGNSNVPRQGGTRLPTAEQLRRQLADGWGKY